MFKKNKIRVLAGDLTNEQINMVHLKFYRRMKDVNSVVFVQTKKGLKVEKVIYWQDIKNNKTAEEMLTLGMF